MWFLPAIIGYGLLSLAAVADKFVLSKVKLHPASFSWVVTSLSGLAGVVLLFFHGSFAFPLNAVWQVVFAGMASYLGCLAMFYAVKEGEVSKVSTLIASAIPLWILLISILGGIEKLKLVEAVGGFLVVIAGYGLSQTGRAKTRINKKTIALVVVSSLAYGFYHSLAKASYNLGEFLPTLAWISLANFSAGLVFTTIFFGPKKIIEGFVKRKNNENNSSGKFGKIAIVIGQVAGGSSSLFLQWAVSLGSVFVVNALQGIQYIFVLGLTSLLTKWRPDILREDNRGGVLWKKILWSLLLATGVFLIVF